MAITWHGRLGLRMLVLRLDVLLVLIITSCRRCLNLIILLLMLRRRSMLLLLSGVTISITWLLSC